MRNFFCSIVLDIQKVSSFIICYLATDRICFILKASQVFQFVMISDKVMFKAIQLYEVFQILFCNPLFFVIFLTLGFITI